MCVARHAQTTQNHNVAKYLQYVKKNVKDEVDFLLADKNKRFHQVNAIILGLCGQACPNYPK